MDPPNNSHRLDEPIVVPQTLSESLEISYQIMFFIIGTPLNISALRRTSRNLREGGAESRLVKLSRQLMLAHIMVLVVYGLWRSWWIYSFFWTQGDFMCRFYSFVTTLPFHLWSNIVAAIAIDMLCCIGSPLNSYRNGATRVRYMIIFSWIAAIACSAPMAFVKHAYKLERENLELLVNTTLPSDYSSSYYQCMPDKKNIPAWVVLWNSYIHVFTSFYLPLVVICVCYAMIGIILHKQMSNRRHISDGHNVTAARTSATKARFLKATVAIVLTYVLTWLPYQVIYLLSLLCEEGSRCASFAENINFLQAIIIASTCINPFLYSFGSDRKGRQSSKGSTVDNGARGTVIVSMPVRRNGNSSETTSFLPPQRTRSVSDLNNAV